MIGVIKAKLAFVKIIFIAQKLEISKLQTNFNSFLLKMKKLNLKFRKKNKPTDVLSFSLKNSEYKKSYIGDIAISFEIVNKRSKLSNFFLEFDKMWLHGYFHLNGYDHKKLKDFKKMNQKEKLALSSLYKTN